MEIANNKGLMGIKSDKAHVNKVIEEVQTLEKKEKNSAGQSYLNKNQNDLLYKQAFNIDDSKPLNEKKWAVGVILSVVCLSLFLVYFVGGIFADNHYNSVSMTPPTRQIEKNQKPSSNVKTKQQDKSEKKVMKYKDIKFIKPTYFGTDPVFSEKDIQWTLRERIRIDELRKFVGKKVSVKKFNHLVDEYNATSSRFRYKKTDMNKAKAIIDKYKQDILDEVHEEVNQGKFK